MILITSEATTPPTMAHTGASSASACRATDTTRIQTKALMPKAGRSTQALSAARATARFARGLPSTTYIGKPLDSTAAGHHQRDDRPLHKKAPVRRGLRPPRPGHLEQRGAAAEQQWHLEADRLAAAVAHVVDVELPAALSGALPGVVELQRSLRDQHGEHRDAQARAKRPSRSGQSVQRWRSARLVASQPPWLSCTRHTPPSSVKVTSSQVGCTPSGPHQWGR